MQAIDNLLLGGDIGFSLVYLWLDPARIEPRHHLAHLDVIALLDQHLGDTLTGVERQIHLAQVHVTEQHRSVSYAVPISQPPCNDPNGYESHDDQNPDADFRHLIYSLPTDAPGAPRGFDRLRVARRAT
jgi:hypothetical protein